MRMRKKKHGAERIELCRELLIPQPTQPPIATDDYFSDKTKPLALEIGCGKGDFAVGMAEKHPETNFIAMEKVPDVACLALEKAMAKKETRPDNLRFLIGDAKNLTDWFAPHTFETIYLNFSDPWPKAGHAKRRLTHPDFLAIYRNLLVPDGVLRFKTDNVGLFEYSLEQFALCGLDVEWQTRDLHNSPYAEGNVMTEYERNFSKKGQVICSAFVRFPKGE